MMLSVVVDKDEFYALNSRLMQRVRELGVAESERRLGMSLDVLLAASNGKLIDVVPSNDGHTVYCRPSARMHEIASLLGVQT